MITRGYKKRTKSSVRARCLCVAMLQWAVLWRLEGRMDGRCSGQEAAGCQQATDEKGNGSVVVETSLQVQVTKK